MNSQGPMANLVFNEVGIMEDDESACRELERSLRYFGCRTIVAENAHEVVRLATERGIRNFILDVHMGTGERSQEGLNALERLKNYDPRIFVGILTAYPGYIDLANKLRADWVDLKTSDIMASVRNMLLVRLALAKREIAASASRLAKDVSGAPSATETVRAPAADHNYASYLKMRRDHVWMRRHVGLFVAFVDGQQVTANRDKKLLIADVRARYSTEPRFITYVTPREESEVVDIPSDLTCDDMSTRKELRRQHTERSKA